MEFIFIIYVFFLSSFMYCEWLNCSNSEECRCYRRHGSLIVANCSAGNLSHFPRFNEQVSMIDFSHNDLTSFPKEIPSNVTYLDICANNIRKIKTTITCCRNLETLKIDHNRLENVSDLRSLFDNLSSLQFLSMKNNTDRSLLQNAKYPVGLFTELVRLTTLHIDGYGFANVGDLFNTNNSLAYLDMSGYERTCIVPLIKKETFQDVVHIKNLSLSYCGIKIIEKGSFEGLRSLEHLDISNNDQLTLDVIPNATYYINPGIQHLNFERLHCISGIIRVLKIDHVCYLKLTRLKTLNLASNRIAYLESGVTRSLPSTLRNLNLGNNLLIKGIYVFELHCLQELEILNISYQNQAFQNFADIMFSCKDENPPKIPACEHQSESNLKVKQIETSEKDSRPPWYDNLNFTFYLPPKLKVFYMCHTQYTFPVDLPVLVNSSITHIYAYNNFFIKVLYPLYNLGKLEYLDVSKNLLTNISGFRENDCTRLEYLNLSYNMLGDALEDKNSSEIFSHFHSLEVLDLSTNRLTGLAPDIFMSLKNIRHLNLSFNKIDEWVVGMSHMKQLKSVDFSYNVLSALNKGTMADLQSLASSNNRISVNLQGNPLMCTCKNLQFLIWLSRSASLGLNFPHLEDYRCVLSNSSSTKIGNISIFVHKMTTECTEYHFITAVCSILILMFLGITACKLLRRYQWSLRYWYYVSRGTPKHYKIKRGLNFRYDAFLSYDEEDSEIALQVANTLETNKRMKLCIPERDFMPGTNIADNIINAIHISRKFICIISTNYVNSQWSMFEFQMAQIDAIHSKFRHEKNMFIVLLLKDTLSVQALNPAILRILESDSCVTYTVGRNSEFLCIEKLNEMLSSKK